MLAIRLPTELEERLALLAQRTGRSKSFLACEAIERHVDDLEDLYLAEAELARVLAGRSKLAPLAEVMKAATGPT